MSSDPITSPTEEQERQEQQEVPSFPASADDQSPTPLERPHVQFSVLRWASTGVVRILYRLWTRVAARLFPENSPGERIAQALHIPLPDKLNMSWVRDVGDGSPRDKSSRLVLNRHTQAIAPLSSIESLDLQ